MLLLHKYSIMLKIKKLINTFTADKWSFFECKMYTGIVTLDKL